MCHESSRQALARCTRAVDAVTSAMFLYNATFCRNLARGAGMQRIFPGAVMAKKMAKKDVKKKKYGKKKKGKQS